MQNYRQISSLTLAIAMAGTVAVATNAAENDALSALQAKIPLSQAVVIAERSVKGRAAKAEFEPSENGWVYDVEVISDNKVFDITVDAFNGQILKTEEDQSDQDDDEDKLD